jgi:hypothetical protein
MSMLTAGFKKVRKALHLPPVTIGNVLTKYAPAAAAIGVGGPLAGIISKVPGGAAVLKAGTAAQAGMGVRPQPRTIPNIGGTFPGFQNPVQLPGAPSAGGDSNWLQDLLGGVGDVVKKGVQYAADNPLNVAMGGLAGARAIQAAKASARQGKLSDEAIGLAKQRWNEAAPLRTAGQAGLLKPKAAVDYNAVFADPTNPFASATPSKRPIPSTRPPVPRMPGGPIGSPPVPPSRIPNAAPGALPVPISRIPNAARPVLRQLPMPVLRKKLQPAAML